VVDISSLCKKEASFWFPWRQSWKPRDM